MKVVLLPIGKMRSRPLSEVAGDYAARLSHYLQFEVKDCKDDKQALSRMEGSDFVVLLDQRGAQISSEELARFIAEHQRRSTKRISFFIGGPEGAGDQVRDRADYLMGLSRMTLPHELAQVVLLEQLYRACSILKGEPYHK